MKAPLIQFIVAIVIALLTLGGYVVWYLKVAEMHTEVKNAAQSAASLEQENAAVANSEDSLAAVTADEALIRNYVLSPEDIVGFLENLERSGTALGSSIEVVSVTPGASGNRIGLALRITGSFAAVMRTLGSIEYAPRDITLENLAFDTSVNDPQAPWTAAVTFSVGSTASTTP